jgi:cysteinyl-tRNA synthetase
MKGMQTLEKLKPSASSTVNIAELKTKSEEAMGDDLNCPVMLSYLFEGVRIINSIHDRKERVDAGELEELKVFMMTFAYDILGLKNEETQKPEEVALLDKLVKMLLQQRYDAKIRKDFDAADNIRNQLNSLGIVVKDTKEGMEWEFE